MTILARSQLIKAIATGELTVTPILAQEQIGAASIDLRLGTVFLMVRARGASHVDPAKTIKTKYHKGEVERGYQQKHERHEIPFKSEFLLHPGSLVLVPTLEWVTLPSHISGVVTARSTWAREGLSIATATFIEPNYNGIVTLELANLGEIPISLYPGLQVAQIAFTRVDGESRRPKGEGQFKMSFEPGQGILAKDGEIGFLPGPSERIAGE